MGIEYGFKFAKKIDYEIADFVHNCVNDTAVTENNPKLTPTFGVRKL
jgi:hypothetical protein